MSLNKVIKKGDFHIENHFIEMRTKPSQSTKVSSASLCCMFVSLSFN
jgi:hypothetical protein